MNALVFLFSMVFAFSPGLLYWQSSDMSRFVATSPRGLSAQAVAVKDSIFFSSVKDFDTQKSYSDGSHSKQAYYILAGSLFVEIESLTETRSRFMLLSQNRERQEHLYKPLLSVYDEFIAEKSLFKTLEKAKIEIQYQAGEVDVSGAYQLEKAGEEYLIEYRDAKNQVYFILQPLDPSKKRLMFSLKDTEPLARAKVIFENVEEQESEEEPDSHSESAQDLAAASVQPSTSVDGFVMQDNGVKSFLNPYLEKKEEVFYVDGVPVKREVRGGNYVCVDNNLNAYPNENLERSEAIKLKGATQVQIVQSENSEIKKTVDGKEYQFIKVSVDGKPYWVAKDYIKSYEECAKIHTEAKVICHDGALNARTENLEEVLRTFNLGDDVLLYRGAKYSKQLKGEDLVYVPVLEEEGSERVLWVSEKYVKAASECEILNQDRIVQMCGGQRVNLSDRFPLEVRPKRSYTSGGRRFNAGRTNSKTGGLRGHAGVDLYTNDGRPIRGKLVYAINDGKVVRNTRFYCGTHHIMVQGSDGNTWNYGEIYYNPNLKVGDTVKKGDVIGRTKKVNCASVPPMLHIEKFGQHIEVHAGRGHYLRHHSLLNPTCHMKMLEKKKFGVSY